MNIILEVENYECEKLLSIMKNSGVEAETIFSYMLKCLSDTDDNWSILKGEQLSKDVSKRSEQ